jgi:hypothetical protein
VVGDHILDLILLVLVVLFAISGYRQGFIVGVLSFIGFVGGVVLGMLIAPPLVKAVVDGAAQQALLAVVIAFLAATLGQLIASSVGSALRSRVTWESARSVDAVGGACVSSVALLVVAWFIGSALVTSPIVWLRTQVKNSQVLHGVDAFMPQQANTWFSSFRGFVSKTEFPQVFGGLGGESLVEDALRATPGGAFGRSVRRRSGFGVSEEGCGRGVLGLPRPGVTFTGARGSLRCRSSFFPKSASRLNIPVSLFVCHGRCV